MSEKHYGTHLMMDLYGCNRDKLESLIFIYDILAVTPMLIDMKRISSPNVLYYNDCPIEDRGISGVVLIAESHLSIHTYPYRRYASFDIFSCKNFDIEFVKRHISSLLESEDYEVNLVKRGLKFNELIKSFNQLTED